MSLDRLFANMYGATPSLLRRKIAELKATPETTTLAQLAKVEAELAEYEANPKNQETKNMFKELVQAAKKVKGV